MNGIAIQPLGMDDRPRLISFLESIDSDFPISLSSKVDLSVYVNKLASFGVIISACIDDVILGVAAGYANDHSRRVAFLSVLGVGTDSRGAGIGSRLVAEFEKQALLMGMDAVSLTTHFNNTAARSLYSRLGYRTDGMIDSMGNLQYSKKMKWLTKERPNVLLSSAGRRTYLVNWFRNALKGEGEVHASNSDGSSTSLRAADHGVVTPLIYSDEYISFMLNYCERNKIGAIIPLFDIDVPILAENRKKFESIGCFPVVGSAEFARICSDKVETCRFLRDAGVPCLPTYVGRDGYLRAVERGNASYPAFIKPRWGMGSIGLAEATNDSELKVLCGIVERKIANSYLRFESSLADPASGVVVQEKVEAFEYGMDIYCDLTGTYQGCVVRRKIAMRAGETDIAEVLKPDERFERLARLLARASHHIGCMDVDLFDIDGNLVVLEMNARFGGGYPFSHASGVDMPGALVSWLRGVDPDPRMLAVKRPGTYMKDMVIVKSDNRIVEY